MKAESSAKATQAVVCVVDATPPGDGTALQQYHVQLRLLEETNRHRGARAIPDQAPKQDESSAHNTPSRECRSSGLWNNCDRCAQLNSEILQLKQEHANLAQGQHKTKETLAKHEQELVAFISELEAQLKAKTTCRCRNPSSSSLADANISRGTDKQWLLENVPSLIQEKCEAARNQAREDIILSIPK